MAKLFSQYASGDQFTAGPAGASATGTSGANQIVDRLNSITTADNLVTGSLVSGTSTEVYGISTAATDVAGLIEIATEDEVQTGTDTERAVVPDTLQSVLPPIGAVIAWLKSFNNVPQTLPSGWVEWRIFEGRHNIWRNWRFRYYGSYSYRDSIRNNWK